MLTDPKYRIKNIVDNIVGVTIDDDATAATILYIYEGGPENLKYLFNTLGYDVVVSFGDPRVRPSGDMREIQDVPVHYFYVYPVNVTAIDKAGVTGTKMQHKMRVAIHAIIEANAQKAGYTIKMAPESSKNRREGGIDRIWETTYLVEYTEIS